MTMACTETCHRADFAGCRCECHGQHHGVHGRQRRLELSAATRTARDVVVTARTVHVTPVVRIDLNGVETLLWRAKGKIGWHYGATPEEAARRAV